MNSIAAGLRPNRIGAGILFMLLAGAMSAGMSAFGRGATQQFSFMEVVFFRFLLAMVPPVAIGLASGGLAALRVQDKRLVLGCGLLQTVTFLTYFISVHLLPLNDAIVLSFANAPFIALLSGPFLKERVTPQRWAAVIGGFIGIIVIANPGSGGLLSVGAIAAIVSAACSGATWMMVRRWGTEESSFALTAWMLSVGSVLCALMMPFFWTAPFWETADLNGWTMLIMVGLFGGAAQLPMGHAYRIAPTAAVAPFYYSAEVFAFFIAWTVWGELPGWRTVIGCAMIVGAAVFLGLHESLSARKRARLAPGKTGIQG